MRDTGSHTVGYPPAKYRFDAQGNVIEKMSVLLGDNGKWHKLEYDGLGRLLRLSLQPDATLLYSLEYDTASAPPFTAARLFLFGRLAKRADSFGTTWYGYDYLGRTLSEYRDKPGCNASKGVYCRPHTFYAWTLNGNIDAITYPFGRVIDYQFPTALERRDRISSISATVWVAGAPQNRTLLQDIAWEPYGGLRGYTANLKNSTIRRAVEYYLASGAESDVGDCATNLAGSSPDGSGRTRGLFVASGLYTPNSLNHVSTPHIFAQRYVSHQRHRDDLAARPAHPPRHREVAHAWQAGRCSTSRTRGGASPQ